MSEPRRIIIPIFALGYLLIAFAIAGANNRIEFSEVMVNPNGSLLSNQYIEFVVAEADTSSLLGYQLVINGIGYRILPVQGEWRVTGGYFLLFPSSYNHSSGRYEPNIPASTPRFIVPEAQFGSNGLVNNSTIHLLLIDSTLRTIAEFNSLVNSSQGFSFERKFLNDSVTTVNWLPSLSSDGTPGRRNSVSPPRIDLGIQSASFSASEGRAGVPIIRIQLIGYGEFGQVSLLSAKFRRFPLQAPFESDSVEVPALAFGTSRFVDLPLTNFKPDPLGWIGYEVRIRTGDDVATNDTLSGESYLWKNVYPVVTEWMPEPVSGEPEWIELKWSGPEAAEFAGWRIRNGMHECEIPFHSNPIGASNRVVFAAGALPNRYHAQPDRVIVGSDWSAIDRNSTVSIVAPWNQVIEVLPRLSELAITPIAGRSLVRRNLGQSATAAGNWYVSCDSTGAAPTREDAADTVTIHIVQPTIASATASISEKRFAPGGVNGLPPELIISGSTPGSKLKFEIFDLSGRKRYRHEEIRPSGDYRISWNGRDQIGSLVDTGIYFIEVSSDERQLLRQSIVVVR